MQKPVRVWPPQRKTGRALSTYPVISALRQKCRSVLPAAAAFGAGGDNSIFLRFGEQSDLKLSLRRMSDAGHRAAVILSQARSASLTSPEQPVASSLLFLR